MFYYNFKLRMTRFAEENRSELLSFSLALPQVGSAPKSSSRQQELLDRLLALNYRELVWVAAVRN